MPLWFLIVVPVALSAGILLLPWLRTVPGLGALPVLPWQAGAGALLTLILCAAWLLLSDHRAAPAVTPTAASGNAAATAENPADSWAGIASALGRSTGTTNTAASQSPTAAQPMAGAIASLQARLAKGGGSADDWELLARSYEFLGRPADAAKARAHELPPLPQMQPQASPATAGRENTTAPAGSGATVSGEVSLAPALKAQAVPGATLFIVAKSIASPGPPVAVYRTTVDRWPRRFELNDSESMLPGRNLSAAGQVTVEARISQSGQALPAAGDLQGTSGPVDPTAHRPLQILIDKVIR